MEMEDEDEKVGKIYVVDAREDEHAT